MFISCTSNGYQQVQHGCVALPSSRYMHLMLFSCLIRSHVEFILINRKPIMQSLDFLIYYIALLWFFSASYCRNLSDDMVQMDYCFCFIRYGGGPTLARRVISSGLSQTEMAVEVYPLRLQLLLMPKSDHSAIRISKKVNPLLSCIFSCSITSKSELILFCYLFVPLNFAVQETIRELHRRACEIFDLNSEHVKI